MEYFEVFFVHFENKVFQKVCRIALESFPSLVGGAIVYWIAGSKHNYESFMV